jgi:hypothetical protein
LVLSACAGMQFWVRDGGQKFKTIDQANKSFH